MDFLFHTGDEDIDHVILDLGKHLLVLVKLVVLGADDDGVDTLWDTSVAVLHRHLTLGVRTEVSHLLSLLADLGQGTHDEVCQVERHRHITLSLIGGIAEHHTLVTCSLLVLVGTVNTLIDVGTLLMDGCQDTAGITVKLVLRLGIANALDGVSGDGLQIDIHFTAHLTHDHYLSCGDKRLDGAAGLVVVCQELV